MEQDKKLKLFISYSHKDEKPYIEEFKKHIAPLKNNGLIEEWYDRKILPGEDFQNKINNNLDDADIVCFFISANFLSSAECQKEKKKALELRKEKGISVNSIILSYCGWFDDKDIFKLLVLPTDGKPISSFQDPNEAWFNVYNGLNNIIKKEIKIRQLKIKEEFDYFLQDTEILTKAHSQKENVLLEDIFVYPDLQVYTDIKEFKKKLSSNELLINLLDYGKIVIAGEDQSGKTTLCKMIFKELRKNNFIPVYVANKSHHSANKIENSILQAFEKQYEGVNINDIDRDRIVPIIDDFHLIKNKENHIKDLSKYNYCILIVDDIFCLNIKDEKLIASFSYFKILEFKHTLRNELIKKWKNLTDKEFKHSENSVYKELDKATEVLDSTLGKIFGKGIMPAYPFFILSTIVTYETFAMSLNQEITSQGYCYQALIYFFLRKQNVKNDEIDIYMNFLTELAFYFYKEKKDNLSVDEFDRFMDNYRSKFNLPIKKGILLKNLNQIVSVDSFNNYSFHYLYLYYFFVAKYIAEHIEDDEIKNRIENLIQNLHVNENAYVVIFIAHHSKNIKILEEIELHALCLFDKYKPATLKKDEVKFFDEQLDIIINAVLPPSNISPEKERADILKIKDKIEQVQEEGKQVDNKDLENTFEKELRRAVKTVEVIGCIFKNRAGSLEKTKLEELFREAMYVHLRILTYFIEIIKNEDDQKSIIDFISQKLVKIVKEKKSEPSEEEKKKISRIIFWNLNFFIILGFINKIVHSLGSDKLIGIIEKVCNEMNTPASFMINHGILMWYNKNLKIDEIADRIKQKDWSEISKRVMKLMIVNHCSLHQINYRDRQEIENRFGIPVRKMFTTSYKEV